jgi:hypothetical protein
MSYGKLRGAAEDGSFPKPSGNSSPKRASACLRRDAEACRACDPVGALPDRGRDEGTVDHAVEVDCRVCAGIAGRCGPVRLSMLSPAPVLQDAPRRRTAYILTFPTAPRNRLPSWSSWCRGSRLAVIVTELFYVAPLNLKCGRRGAARSCARRHGGRRATRMIRFSYLICVLLAPGFAPGSGTQGALTAVGRSVKNTRVRNCVRACSASCKRNRPRCPGAIPLGSVYLTCSVLLRNDAERA